MLHALYIALVAYAITILLVTHLAIWMILGFLIICRIESSRDGWCGFDGYKRYLESIVPDMLESPKRSALRCQSWYFSTQIGTWFFLLFWPTSPALAFIDWTYDKLHEWVGQHERRNYRPLFGKHS